MKDVKGLKKFLIQGDRYLVGTFTRLWNPEAPAKAGAGEEWIGVLRST